MRVVLIQYISFFVRGGTFGQRYEGRNQVREDNDWDCVITAQQQSGRQMLEMARKDPPQSLAEGLWRGTMARDYGIPMGCFELLVSTAS